MEQVSGFLGNSVEKRGAQEEGTGFLPSKHK